LEKLKNFLSSIKQIWDFNVIDGETVKISIGTLLSLVLVILAFNIVLKIIRKLLDKRLDESDRFKFVSVYSFLRYLFYLLAVVTVLHTSGIDLTVFLTASAALFVGIGFALQYLFQDIISGVLIITDQSLHVGDVIELEGKIGKVTEINLRTTRAVTRDDKVIVIPNHKFLIESIYNHTQNRRSTIEKVSVGVAYGSDTELVQQILIDIASNQKGVLKSPKPFVLFEDFGDSALNFSVIYTTADSFGDNKIKSDIRFKIDKAFREKDINIPFPQRTVHLVNPTK